MEDHGNERQERPVGDFKELEYTEAYIAMIKQTICRICHTLFSSKNKLHNHLQIGPCLKESGGGVKRITAGLSKIPTVIKKDVRNHTESAARTKEPTAYFQLTYMPNDELQQQRIADSTATTCSSVVSSNADGMKGDGYGFKDWHYATIEVKFAISGDLHTICLDTGCTMSLIDRAFLAKEIPRAIIQKMASPISVRGIGSTDHKTNEYVLLDFYILHKDNRTAHLRRELHVVEELHANILIGIDIMGPEGIVLDVNSKTAIIKSCDEITTQLTVTPRSSQRIRRSILNSYSSN